MLYADLQDTRRDRRKRDRIKTPGGLQWLTVPVQVKGRYEQTMRETLIEAVCQRLDIPPRLSNSWDCELQAERSERRASICGQAGASVYASGPAARDDLDQSVLARRHLPQAPDIVRRSSLVCARAGLPPTWPRPIGWWCTA